MINELNVFRIIYLFYNLIIISFYDQYQNIYNKYREIITNSKNHSKTIEHIYIHIHIHIYIYIAKTYKNIEFSTGSKNNKKQ